MSLPGSIASTALSNPKRIELTVGLSNWWDEAGREHVGAVSGRLCRTLQIGTRITASLRHHSDFNLPDDPDRPVAMIGTGCGVAPFIGFLAEIDAASRKTPTWLIFGNRRASGDFFHRKRIEDWLDRKILTRLDTAFSRDEADGAYVQNGIIENGAEIVRWPKERDAVLYVCGRASTLRAAVDKALCGILVAHADLTPEKSREMYRGMDDGGQDPARPLRIVLQVW